MSDPGLQPLSEEASFRESPLHYMALAAKAKASVTLVESDIAGTLIIRGTAEMAAGFENATGLSLPVLPSSFVLQGERAVYWLGPEEWMLRAPLSELQSLEEALSKELSGHVAVIDVSATFTLIRLHGVAGAELMRKSTVYDIDQLSAESSSGQETGRAVQTTMAKAGALIVRRADKSFELIVRRSFADYVARWLLDAGAEFGIGLTPATQA